MLTIGRKELIKRIIQIEKSMDPNIDSVEVFNVRVKNNESRVYADIISYSNTKHFGERFNDVYYEFETLN